MEEVYELIPHKIRVSFQANGIYQFTAESATGKTYLYKQACKLYKSVNDILPVTYMRGVDMLVYLKEQLQQIGVKIIVLDRLDLYVSKALLTYLEYLHKDYIILLDCKRSFPGLQVRTDICYIELERDEINIYDYASIRRQQAC